MERIRVFLVVPALLIAAVAPAATQQDDPVEIGAWSYKIFMDRQTAVQLQVFGVPPNADLAGLSITCVGAALTQVVYVTSDRFVGDGAEVDVRYRIDTEPPTERERWEMATDTNLIAGSEAGEKLVSAMLRGDRSVLLEAIDPGGGKVITHRFSLDGFAEVIGRIGCEVAGSR